MPPQPKTRPRNATETKARILDAAQAAFSEKGYSQTGLRDIAKRAGVATSLVIKYFDTKARLFELALMKALEVTHVEDQERPHFGEILVRTVINPRMKIVAPAMIALSLGDADARQISAKVAEERIIGPVAEWLGPPQARARAANILMMSVGFAIFSRHLRIEPSKAVREETARCMEEALQELTKKQ